MPNLSLRRRRLAGHPMRAPASTLAAMIALALAPAAHAGPEGGVVSAGQAQVTKTGNLTSIRQQSNRAVIDWRSFNVGANEAVNFAQPDARSATLNRVQGSDGSTILGRITANGNVFVINPNGVLFGTGAQVNVGGLVASTANISNANFMAGNDRFEEPGNPGAKVENRGTIRIADRGIAALVGRQVSNAGFIVATLGKVALAGGDAFVIDLSGDRLVNLILNAAAMEQVRDAQGRPLSARIDNTGNIQASGGRIEFSADTVSRLLDNVINVLGDIRAVSVGATGGVISLRGGATTDITLGGVLQPGGRSGRIDVAGRDITLAATTQLDLGQGADLQLNATRNLALNAPLNALRDGSVAGAGLTASAGADLTIAQSIALNDGALSLSAGSGRLVAASGTVLQAGNQAITLRGDGGVAVDRLLTSGAVDISSSAGSVEVASPITAASGTSTALPVARLVVAGARGITLNGALASGDIALQSGGDLTLRSASLESRGGQVGLRADGRIASSDPAVGIFAPAGNATVAGGGDVALPAVIASGDIVLTSGGTLSVAQSLGNAGATASRSVNIDSGGNVTLAGAHASVVRIQSRSGSVASGDLVATGAVSVIAGGGRAGTAGVPLKISAGDAMGAAGVDGGARVEGRDGVAIGTLVTRGAVLLRSGNGGVSVATSITGSAASALADAMPTRTVRIEAAGDVILAGARTGAGGVTVAGASAGAGAGSFTLAGGSLLSDGDVSATSVGGLRTDALIRSGGSVTLTSTAGPLTIGAAGVRASTAGRGISLLAGGDLQLNGDLQALAATVSLVSTGGRITASVATPGVDPVAADAAIDAGSDAQTSKLIVSANGDVTLGSLRAAGSTSISSASGNVMLLSPLGGAGTGYLRFDNGYQASLRPDVGSLTITAPTGSVELNGLNIDGLADPHAVGTGLSVTAGRMVLSNGTIAVNKGDILLQGGSTQPSDGVYLGSSVFSRGWDSVGSDGQRNGVGTAADVKLGYGIRITGRNLGLFDNNIDVADLPGLFTVTLANGTTRVLTDSQAYLVDANGVRLLDGAGKLLRAISATSAVDGAFAVSCPASGCINDIQVVGGQDTATNTFADSAVLGLPTFRTVGKVEVANNVANFQDTDPITRALSSTLVPLTSALAPRKVLIDTSLVGGVVNSVVSGDGGRGGRQALASFAPVMGGLSQTPIRVTPAVDGRLTQASTRGMVLKLLGFEAAQDVPTEVWNTRVAFGGNVSAPFTKPTDPGATGFQNIVFPDGGPGKTFVQGLFNGEGISAGPVGGAFTLTVRGDVTYKFSTSPTTFTCNNCDAVYTFQRLPGPLSAFSIIKATALRFDGSTNTFTPVLLNELAVGTYLQIRFDGAPVLATPGQAAGAEIRGTLLAGGSADYAGALGSGSAPAPSKPVSIDLPPWSQSGSGTLRASVFNIYTRPQGYLLGRVVVDSSTSVEAYPASERGTRIQIFDGVLDTQLGRVSGDSTGGVNFIPGFGGIPGNNNSSTGFTSVGAAVGSSAGRSGATTTGTASARLVAGATGVVAGSGVSAAPTAAADPGFALRVDVADRSTQDALSVAESSAATRPIEGQGELIEIGQGPAALADFGRNGSLAGATTNVFKRSYQVATSADSVVCAPGAIVQRPPTADAPAAPAAPGALARDCKPPRR